MKIGDTVKIKECALVPELVGENAEIVDMQIQEYEKYRLHPVWAKMPLANVEARFMASERVRSSYYLKGMRRKKRAIRRRERQ